MGDADSAVDLASLAAAGDRPGALWRLDGEDLQANLIRLGLRDRIKPHRNDEVEVLMVVVAGRGELTLDGQVHPLAPMTFVHVPKGWTLSSTDTADQRGEGYAPGTLGGMTQGGRCLWWWHTS
jgi:hypothetical protein